MNKRFISTPKQGRDYQTNESNRNYQKANLQKQKTYDSQKQKVILDQHYSNNIMMTTLSTLESLEAAYNKTKIKRENKAYGYYDKVNYDDKNFLQLKSQLQTQLIILKASRQVFQEENSKSKYELPSSFGQQKVKSQINNFKKVFRDERQIFGMCQDFQKIVQGGFNSKMNFQTKDYAIKYPAEEEKGFKTSIIKNGMHASKLMDNQKEYIEKLGIKNPKDLPIYYNTRNNPRSLW